MRESETLFALALAFYLFECLIHVPVATQAVARSFRRWRWRPPFVLRSGAGPAFALTPPWWPGSLTAFGARGQGRLDRALAAARVADFVRATRLLRALETALFVAVFGGGALLVWWERAPLERVFVLMGGLWLCVVIEAIAVQRAQPAAQKAAWRDVIVAMTSPIAAMRLHDVIGKRLCADLDGLALAAALLPEAALFEVMRPALARARYLGDGDAAALGALAAESGLDAELLAAPPERESPDALGWCPVCRAQFVRLDVECASDGVALVPYSR
ncbi:MAG: hypothetical protein U1F43_21485 [Myxococcota bacterium]